MRQTQDDLPEGRGRRRVRPRQHRGHSQVSAQADLRVERDAPQQRYAELSAQVLRAAGGKQIHVPLAVGTDEPAHVLDEAEQGDAQFAAKRGGARGVGQGHRLRGRHEQRAVQWDGLNNLGQPVADGSYKLSAKAVLGGAESSVGTMSYGMVNSVMQGTQGATLNVEKIGEVSLSSVKQIL